MAAGERWRCFYPSVVQLADPALPHQIVLRFDGNGQIMVSCNCLRRKRPTGAHGGAVYSYVPLGVRRCWQPGEAAACWREHMARVRRRDGG